jgi:23S rRNA (cytosine1962-C5)-methyltransferase
VVHFVTLSDNGAARVRGGLTWVYASDVTERCAPDVELCTVRDRRGSTLATALYSANSPVPLRVLGRGEVVLDRAFLAMRLDAALARRTRDGYEIHAKTDSAARLVHGEADGIPGLIVDRYADVLSLQTMAPALDRREMMVAELLRERTGARLVVARNDGSARDLESLPRRTGILSGEGPTTVRYRDAGSLVEIDVLTDGKTGGYLDQVENHAVAKRYAHGDCLDAFTYHGGFALAMCAGGARSVLALDESSHAIARARANAERNGYHQLQAEAVNAFDRLRALEAANRRFDTIVVDPPALAKRKGRTSGDRRAGVNTALRAYKELNLRALRMLVDGGVLVACSCSGRVSMSEFGEMLESAAADAGRTVQLLERRGAGRDHPLLLGVPETEYLKCFVLRAIA